MKKNLLFVAALSFSCFLKAQVFVAPNGTGDGSSWESPLGSIIDAARSIQYQQNGKITVYVKEGTYAENPSRNEGFGDNSNMPDGYDVEIIGGYSSSLTSADLIDGKPCGYDPIKYPTYLDNGNVPMGGESWFRINGDDGSLTVKGFNFLTTNSDEAWLSAILTVTSKDNGTYILQDLFVNEVPDPAGDPGNGGLLGVRGTSKNNTFLVKNVIVQNVFEAGAIAFNASTEGNTLTVENSTFKNVNVTAYLDGGGVIRMETNNKGNKNKLNVKNSIFCNNRTFLSLNGGAIHLENVIAHIENSKFISNRSGGGSQTRGGAIHAEQESEVTSVNNYYAKNESFWGGAICVRNESTLTSTNDVFVGNEVNNHGGAIHFESSKKLVIKDSKFYKNIARNDDGGAIRIKGAGGISVIENAEFGANEARNGGALYIESGDTKILSSKFDANKAERGSASFNIGGAIFAEKSAIYAKDNCFTNNTATDGGSGMFVKDDKGAGVFDVPSGYTYSNNASRLRQISYNNKFYKNTSGFAGTSGGYGVVGGALVYESIRSQSGSTGSKEGNIAILENEFYENDMYLEGVVGDQPAAGVTLKDLGTNGDDNIVAFAGNKFAGNRKSSGSSLSDTASRVDVAVWRYAEAAIFEVHNNKFQLAQNNDNYPPLKRGKFGLFDLDWEGIGVREGNGNTFNNTTVVAPTCSVDNPDTGFSCPPSDFSGINSDYVTADKCTCPVLPANGTPLQTLVGVSTFNRNVETWLPQNLGAYIVLESSKKGFVITRTTANSVQSPEKGMIIWDTQDKCLKLYSDKDNTGAAWHCITTDCNQ